MAWIRWVAIATGVLASDAASACSCIQSTPEENLARAEACRPYWAYAAANLWAVDAVKPP